MRPLRRLAGTAMTVLLAILVMAALAATVGPLFLPYRTYAVLSGSMEPAIPVGALVVDLPATPQQLRQGDVVTFHRPNRPGEMVTHRVVQLEATSPAGVSYRTRGDSNGSPDPWLIAAQPTNWRVAASLPLVGYTLGYLRSPLGQLLTLVVPGMLLGVMFLRDLWRQPSPSPAPARR